MFKQEIDKRKRLQEAYRTALSEKSRPIILGGPDFEVRKIKMKISFILQF